MSTQSKIKCLLQVIAICIFITTLLFVSGIGSRAAFADGVNILYPTELSNEMNQILGQFSTSAPNLEIFGGIDHYDAAFVEPNFTQSTHDLVVLSKEHLQTYCNEGLAQGFNLQNSVGSTNQSDQAECVFWSFSPQVLNYLSFTSSIDRGDDYFLPIDPSYALGWALHQDGVSLDRLADAMQNAENLEIAMSKLEEINSIVHWVEPNLEIPETFGNLTPNSSYCQI